MFTTLSGPDIPEIAIETEGPMRNEEFQRYLSHHSVESRQNKVARIQTGCHREGGACAAPSGLVAGIRLLIGDQPRKMIIGCHPRATQSSTQCPQVRHGNVHAFLYQGIQEDGCTWERINMMLQKTAGCYRHPFDGRTVLWVVRHKQEPRYSSSNEPISIPKIRHWKQGPQNNDNNRKHTHNKRHDNLVRQYTSVSQRSAVQTYLKSPSKPKVLAKRGIPKVAVSSHWRITNLALHSNILSGYSSRQENKCAAPSGLVAGIKLLTRYQTRKMISGYHPRASQEKHASENGGMLSSPD